MSGAIETAESIALTRRIGEARVTSARGNPSWREVSREQLEPRRFGILVDRESGERFSVYRGVIWDRGKIEFHEKIPMVFYVDGDAVVVLEPLSR